MSEEVPIPEETDELLRDIPLRREINIFSSLNEAFNILIPDLPLNIGALLQEEIDFLRGENMMRRAPETELSKISSDVENVHDSKVNKNIKKLASEILKFPPSSDIDVMKIIFTEISMSDEIRAQLTYMYYKKDRFLDYGEASYRKFMDCIISFALTQPEEKKKEIFTILTNEIKDSIGLCFQGNISRLINVLSGFLEIEITYEPSIQEVFAEISKIEDKNIKFEKAIRAFDDFAIEYSQWNHWLEALGLE